MQSKPTYIDSLLTRREEWNKELSAISKKNLQLETVRISELFNIEQQQYLEFLELLFYASTQEQPLSDQSTWVENAKTHALKLIFAYGSINNAISYINRYEKVVKHTDEDAGQLIHNACLFSLPAEISDDQAMLIWQKILTAAKPNGPNDEIMRLLPLAQKVVDYIQDPFNKNAITSMVREEVENKFRNKYKMEFKNINKMSLEQWIEQELKNNPKLVLNDKLKSELQAAWQDETAYVQFKLAHEKFLPSTIKSKLNTIIPCSGKTPVLYIKKIANTLLYKRANENPEAANIFFKQGISENEFNLYLSLKPDNSHEYIPDVTIEGKNIHDNYKKFRLEKLNAFNPQAAILGKLTSCCQSLGSQGEACAIHGIENKKGGFYVIYDTAKNKIIAQCWAWYGTNGNIVFDSIEITLNYKKYETMIMDFYVELANQIVQKYNVPYVLVGKGGETPKGMQILTASMYNSSPPDYSGYRDSIVQALVASRELPLLVETYKDINPDSLLFSKPVGHMGLFQLQRHCDLYVLNNMTLTPRMEELFESRGFKKEVQLQCIELTNLWLAFLNEKTRNYESLQLQEIQYFVDRGINLNIASRLGTSILNIALKGPSVETVKYLIKNGAAVTPMAFHTAVFSNNVGMANFLLMSAPIDLNALFLTVCIDFSRYRYAFDYSEMMKFLLAQKGIEINCPDKIGDTALHSAAKDFYERTWLIHILLKHGADVQYKNTQGQTPLDIACEQKNRPAIKELLSHAKMHSLSMESIMSPKTFNTIFPCSETNEQKLNTRKKSDHPLKSSRFFNDSSSSSSDSDEDDLQDEMRLL